MTFERPEFVWLGVAALALCLAGIGGQWRRASRLRQAFGGPSPMLRLLGHDPAKVPALRLIAASSAVVALALAGAGLTPAEPEPVEPTAPIDLILAVDVSHSMSATDVEDSRADRARSIVEEIVDAQLVDRIALTLFADWPFGLVPLSEDPEVVDFFAPWVAPELVANRDQGTSLAAVLGHARTVWADRAREESNPILLLVSDGEVHGDDAATLDSTRALLADGITVWTAGIGTVGGAPLFVPGSDEAPFLDGSGNQVVAEFAPDLLQSIADEGQGAYYDVSTDGGLRSLLGDLRRESGATDSIVARSGDPLFWLLLIGLLAAAVDAIADTGRRRQRAPEEARG